MSEKEKNRNQELPSLSRGVGGAGRVSGLLSDDKANHSFETLKRLFSEIKGNRLMFIFTLILTIIASLSQIYSPKLIGQVINFIDESFGTESGLNWQGIGQSLLILLILYIVYFLASYIATTSMVSITQRVIANLRLKMDSKLNSIPLSYFDTVSAGDLSSLLTNDLDNVANTLQSGLTSSITAVVVMVGVFVMMFMIHPALSFLTLIIVPFSYFIVKFLVRKAKPTFQKNASTTGKLNGQIEESFSGQDVVSSYHLEEELIEEMTKLNEDLYDTEWKSSFVSFMTRPAGDLMLNANYVIVSIVGGYSVINGSLSLGDFQAFLQYVRMFNSPFRQVMGIMNTILSALASAERIYSFLDTEELKEHGRDSLDSAEIKGDVIFENVDFAYDLNYPLFKKISLKVPEGQQIAIVGSTGAGKTTLVNLLMRFYDIQDGYIYLDGKDIKKFETSKLRNAFAMVLQDTWLFEGTIGDNIAYGYPLEVGESLDVVPREDIENAARMARADHFIELFPDGYDTLLTDGASNISAGQRQLLTIARAMIKQAPITILDEATSSVDTRTEALIQEGMKELTQYNTSFIIAHRLSTIRSADQILVMDKGTIVETGNHEELLESDGLYAKMYKAGQAS